MNWRDDPGWVLAAYDIEVYPRVEDVPERPPPGSELAPEKLWASEYRRGRRDPVATWWRELPIEEKVRTELARKSARRTGVDSARPIV